MMHFVNFVKTKQHISGTNDAIPFWYPHTNTYTNGTFENARCASIDDRQMLMHHIAQYILSLEFNQIAFVQTMEQCKALKYHKIDRTYIECLGFLSGNCNAIPVSGRSMQFVTHGHF